MGVLPLWLKSGPPPPPMREIDRAEAEGESELHINGRGRSRAPGGQEKEGDSRTGQERRGH
jgi:hypothetical protein